MKKCIFLFILLLTLFLSLNQGNTQTHKIPEIPRISAEIAYLKYKAGQVVIIDTMNPRTYKKYHIIGAISLPGDGPGAIKYIEEARLPIPLDKEIILYCD